MQKNLISFIIIFIFLAVAGFFLFNANRTTGDLVRGSYVKIAGKNIKVELATTSAEQQKGLSARTFLAENEGMLFVFDKSGIYPFWMKDMRFAIDIIWLAPSDVEGIAEVVYIKKDARLELYPETYGAKNEQGLPLLSKYVLEVVSGFSDKNNLKVGDKALFTY